MAALLHRGTEKDVAGDLFLKLDANADGQISPEEFRAGYATFLSMSRSRVDNDALKESLAKVTADELEGHERAAQSLIATRTASLGALAAAAALAAEAVAARAAAATRRPPLSICRGMVSSTWATG